MADRVQFYFKQRVSEDELNLPFEQLERADHNLAADIGVYGIVSGAEPVAREPVPDLSIDLVAPGRAYDRIGQRIFFGTGQNVSCARDSAGVSSEVITQGRERWLGVFLRFRRLPSDERTDGNSQRILFRQDESFEVVVRQGPEGPAGQAVRVPLEDDEILICDVRRVFGVDRILREHIDVSRRQALVFARADAVGVDAEQWRTLQPSLPQLQSTLDEVDHRFADHVGGQADRHTARDVTLAPTGFVTSLTVQDGLAEVVQKLGSAAGDSAGASLVGADPVGGLPRALPAGTVDSQLALLLGYLNAHLSAATAAHAASAIRASPHSWLTSESVQAQLQELVTGLRADRIAVATYRHLEATNLQAQLQELVDDLRSRDDALGTALIGGAALPGNPREVGAGTLLQQLRRVVDQLNAHAGSADHDSRYLRRVFSGAADVGANATVTIGNVPGIPAYVEYAYDTGLGTDDFQRHFNGPLSANIRVWAEKTDDDSAVRIRVQNRNSATVHVVVGAYMGG